MTWKKAREAGKITGRRVDAHDRSKREFGKEKRGRYLVLDGLCIDPSYVRKSFERNGTTYSKIIKETIKS